MYDINQLRRNEFPNVQDYAYMNNAGIAPIPNRTKEKVQWVTEQLSGNPSGFWEKIAMPAGAALYENLARHINAASPSEIVLVTTTSSAINMAAQAIAWKPGDNILISEVEFPSNAYPWISLERDGVEIRRIPAPEGGLKVDDLVSYTDKKTRLIAVSTVQFLSGNRADLTAIGAYCHERGILFSVDAIQSIFHIPVDVQSMHIDILATGGQKSLLALPGSGFMYVRSSLAEQLKPRIIGSNATVDYIHWLAYDLTPLPGAARFNSGTPNLPGMFSIAASLELVTELTLPAIDAHTSALSRYTRHELSNLGLMVITPEDPIGPIVSFRSPVATPETDAMVAYLAEQKVIVTKHLDAAGAPYIRLSFHCYNQTEDVDRFVAAYKAWRKS